MKTIVDPTAIRSVGEYMETEKELLIEMQQKLKADINSISLSYRGIDADKVIEKYLRRAEELKGIIENFDNFANYLKYTSNRYTETLESSKNRFDKNRIINAFENEVDLELEAEGDIDV